MANWASSMVMSMEAAKVSSAAISVADKAIVSSLYKSGRYSCNGGSGHKDTNKPLILNNNEAHRLTEQTDSDR